MGLERIKKSLKREPETLEKKPFRSINTLRNTIFLAVIGIVNSTCVSVKYIPTTNAATVGFSLEKVPDTRSRDEAQPSKADIVAMLNHIERARLLTVFHEKQGSCNLSENTIHEKISEHQSRVKGSELPTSETVNITGLENIYFLQDDLSAITELREILRKYLYNTVPGTWLNANNIREIRINPQEIKLSHPGLEDKFAGATYHTDENGHGIVEIISMELIRNPVEAFARIVAGDSVHEIVHANAPETSPYTSDEESIQDGVTICNLVIPTGRPKFAYIEGIRSDNPEKTEEVLVFRLREYYAVLMEVALSQCNILADSWDKWELSFAEELIKYNASPDEARANAQIAREILEKAAPDFFPFKTCKNAQKNAREFTNAIKYYYYKSMVAKLPDGKIKTRLISYFQPDAVPVGFKQSNKSKISTNEFRVIKAHFDKLAEAVIQITFEHTSPDTSSSYPYFLDTIEKLRNMLLGLNEQDSVDIID